MNIPELIKQYFSSLPEDKSAEMQTLHQQILKSLPKCKLWYLDGKDEKGKVVSNPNIGYGSYSIKYKDGKSREFYQIGLSANTNGISVYIMGLEDKTYLAKTYSKKIGKATVTGYCIKFKSLSDIHIDVLLSAIKYGVEATAGKK